MKKLLCLLVGCVALSLTNGCGVYKTAVDERNIGRIISDEWISGKITTQYIRDDIVKALDIDVNSYAGDVYLAGEYDNGFQRNRAISIAKNVKGVQSVTPYLLLKKENDLCGASDNLIIRGKLEKNLISDDRIWSTNVDVAVVQCHIVLMGIVGSEVERMLAERYARDIPEARNVQSYLRVQ